MEAAGRPHDPTDDHCRMAHPGGRLEPERAHFHPDLQPRENDTVLLPHKSCDVFQTDLPEHLRRMGITHLVIAG